MEIMEMKTKTVDWNKLSEWGLLYKINKNVLHPLGLALSRNPETGFSENCMIDPSEDLMWEYEKSLTENNEEKFAYFLNNRIEILTNINKSKEK